MVYTRAVSRYVFGGVAKTRTSCGSLLRIIYFTLYYRFKLGILINYFGSFSYKSQRLGVSINHNVVFKCKLSFIYCTTNAINICVRIAKLNMYPHLTPLYTFGYYKVRLGSLPSQFLSSQALFALSGKQPLCTSSNKPSIATCSSHYQLVHDWASKSVGNVGPFCLSLVRPRIKSI